MNIPIETPAQMGAVLRLVRKTQRVRSDDLAGAAGVGPVFVLDVEKGKPTVQLGKVLQVLQEAGIKVNLELPSNLDFEALRGSDKRKHPGSYFIAKALSRTGEEKWARRLAEELLLASCEPSSDDLRDVYLDQQEPPDEPPYERR